MISLSPGDGKPQNVFTRPSLPLLSVGRVNIYAKCFHRNPSGLQMNVKPGVVRLILLFLLYGSFKKICFQYFSTLDIGGDKNVSTNTSSTATPVL